MILGKKIVRFERIFAASLYSVIVTAHNNPNAKINDRRKCLLIIHY